MKDLHAVGGDGFQHRDAGSESGKNSSDKEQDAHEGTGLAHSGKHLGQRDEHQAGACTHALGAGEHIHGRNDHGTGQQSHTGIKNLDLVHGFVQVDLRFDVGTVGDHNAHRHAEGEEQLAHGVQQDLQKAADGQPFHVRGQVVAQPFHTGAHLAGSVLVAQGEGVTSDHHHQHQQNGHHVAGHPLNAALHAVVHDESRHAHEQQSEHHRRHRRGNEAGKITVLRSGGRLSGEVDHRIFRDPPADDGIVGHDQNRHQKGQDAEEFPLGAHRLVGADGTLLGAASDGDIRGEQGETEGQHQHQIHQQKQTAAILCGKVREPPQVADTHRTSGGSKDKSDLSGETACFLFHDSQTPILKTYCNIG